MDFLPLTNLSKCPYGLRSTRSTWMICTRSYAVKKLIKLLMQLGSYLSQIILLQQIVRLLFCLATVDRVDVSTTIVVVVTHTALQPHPFLTAISL